ncbi:MAG: C_GCAxxG_C_C family protein [Oscillospiraceae bacterium]|nr:C_GCAxxG_C_C family protein [Oscillospiraceae bacterium]
MDVKKEATRIHESGHNCAQSVFCSCREYTGIDDKTALAVSGGFGGGVRCGEICGALSGAVMAIGAAYPFNVCDDQQAKDKIAALTVECTGKFKEKFGWTRCYDLKASGASCPKLIEFGAELAEQIIKENK